MNRFKIILNSFRSQGELGELINKSQSQVSRYGEDSFDLSKLKPLTCLYLGGLDPQGPKYWVDLAQNYTRDHALDDYPIEANQRKLLKKALAVEQPSNLQGVDLPLLEKIIEMMRSPEETHREIIRMIEQITKKI